jgi:hypothetical protein
MVDSSTLTVMPFLPDKCGYVKVIIVFIIQVK